MGNEAEESPSTIWSTVALLVTGAVVLVLLVAQTELGSIPRILIALACGLLAAGITHALVLGRQRG